MPSQPQRHNHSPDRKVAIRRQMVEEMGGLSGRRVLDLFAGHGTMRDRVWTDADGYMGVDIDPSTQGVIHAPAEVVVQALDVSQFSVFDADAFSNPWEVIWMVSERRSVETGECIGIAATDGRMQQQRGMGRRLAEVPFSRQMLDATGWSPEAKASRYVTQENRKRAAHQFFEKWFDAPLAWYGFVPSSGHGAACYMAAVIGCCSGADDSEASR